ncbi:MAG: response regulator [Flavipsychrobacter sp.]|jgi:CheY-like chemotaxis protein|nr:response regulator [Flavipsychrobacter sp.]
MAQTKQHFIVIDDSKLDCFIAEKIIRNTGKSESIRSFQVAKDALEYIQNTKPDENAHTVILVDIQMPVMNGFEFVEEFEKLPLHITSHYTIYIISSSINDNDLNRVHNYPSVKQFLNKPINSNNLAILLQS